MPLQKDTITVGLAKSVNQKVDDKILDSSQMTSVSDLVFDKDEQLVKRFGQTAQSTTVVSSFPNPLAIGASTFKTTSFAHENQLCQINNGALYSQTLGQNKWLFKGHCAPVQVSWTKQSTSAVFTDTVTLNGITVLAGPAYLYVVEDSTGNVLSKTAGNYLKVIAFSGAVWALTSSGTNLQASQVSLVDGSVGAPTTIASDFSSNSPAIETAFTTSSALPGEVCFIAYQSTGNVKITPMTSAGSIHALGVLNTGITAPTAMSVYVEPSVSQNKLYFSFIASGAGIKVGAWTFTSSAYTVSFAVYTIQADATTNFQRITQCINPVNNTDLWIFYDTHVIRYHLDPASGFVSQTDLDSLDAILYYSVTSITGTPSIANATYGVGYQLCGKPIRDTARNTIYLPCVVFTPFQTTLFLFDVLKGKSGVVTYAAAKVLYGLAAQVAVLSQCNQTSSSSGIYRITNNGYLVTFALVSTYAQNKVYTAKTTHLTGGLLWAYDGDTITEHNFLIGPERQEAWAGSAAALTVNVVGDGSHSEQFTLLCAPGVAFPTWKGSGPQPYIGFNTTGAAYYLWFKRDGTGTDPIVAGRTAIQVNINSTDTGQEVAIKIAAAVNGAGILAAASTIVTGAAATNAVVIVNSANGAVTAPSVNNLTRAIQNSPAPTALSTGSYQYAVVFKWTDRSGNVYRSAPSVASTVTATAADFGAILFWAPPITNKNASDVSYEIYRTLANATVLQLLKTGSLVDGTSRIAYSDSVSDATLASGAIIYTDGGVLENYNMGACTALSTFKNRLMISPVDDITAVYYSRSNVSGEPMNFSAFNAIRYDSDGLPITAHAQMDDKLAAFKANSAYVTAGDGSNDLGQSETFQLPMKLPGDIGCLNPNSLILCKVGLIFQSPTKGIYALTRGLSMEYAGAAVDSFKGNVVSSAVLASNFDHIIFGLQDSSTALVYNQLLNRWDFWTAQQSDSACLWQGHYVRAQNAGKVFVAGSNYYDYDSGNVAISTYIETPWLKLKGLEGFQRVYRFQLLGEYKSAHSLTFTVYYDYNLTSPKTYTFDASTIASDPPYQIEVQLAQQKCEAIKVAITETPATGTQQSFILNALEFSVGYKGGLNRVKASKSI